MCVGVKFQALVCAHTHTHRGFAVLGVFCHAPGSAGGSCEASGTEDNVWLWAECGPVNMQIIIIVQ